MANDWSTDIKAAPIGVLLLLTSPSARLVLATRSKRASTRLGKLMELPEWTAQGGKFLAWEPVAWKLAPAPYPYKRPA